jgi:class 3 adenylate cyclase
MLPPDASEHLITTSSLDPTLHSNWGKIHENVTILFVSINLDYKEDMMQEADSGALIEDLNYIFSLLDSVLDQHTECYKVETVCNVYVVSAGVPSACEQHAQAAAALACHMAALLDQFLPPSGKAVSWQMGLHSGQVFAGIAGRICPRYRLFGDTINTASRMCSVSARGSISASRTHIECLINQRLQIPADLRSNVTVPLECWLRRDNAHGVEESVVECHDVLQHVDHVVLHLSGCQNIKGKGVMEVWSLRPLIKALKQVPSAEEANHSNGAETGDVGLRASASMSTTPGDHQRQTSGQQSKPDNTLPLLPHSEIGGPRTRVEIDSKDNKQDILHSQTATTSSHTAATSVCGLSGAGRSVYGDNDLALGGRGRGEGQARGYSRVADGRALVGPRLRHRKSAGVTSGESSFSEVSLGDSLDDMHSIMLSCDPDSIVLSCEEETAALLLACGSNGQGGWPKEHSSNGSLERISFRRRCIASLPRTFVAVVCVGTLSGVLLFLEMDILMSHPRLRPAAILALCCWGIIVVAGLVLGCIYYSSTSTGSKTVNRSQLSYHLQVVSSTLAALSLYFLINFQYLERLSHWGGESGKEWSGKAISTSETDFAGMLSAINSHWLPRTRGFVYMTSMVSATDAMALFFCKMQVCFDLPMWCALCLVALNIQQTISYFKFAGAGYTLEIKTQDTVQSHQHLQTI